MSPVAPPRPAVHANCAISLDGRLAYAGGRRARLSGPEDLERVQQLRLASGAILVGVNTVLLDDPSLRVHYELLGRKDEGRHPVRVVLDSRGRLPPQARVLDGSLPTIVATSGANRTAYPKGVERIVCGTDRVELPRLLRELSDRGIRRLLVEGGASVLSSFFRSGLVDRFTVYVAPVLIGGRTAPPLMGGPETAGPEGAVALTRVAVEPLGEGVLLTFAPAPGGHAPL